MKIEKIGAAILRMMQSTRQEEDRLFYGSILLKTIIEQSTKVPTMGVCIKNSELYLYYNPAFVEPLTMLELIAVLEHEVLHIIYEHMNVNKEVERTVHNIACDIAINQMIQNLPKGCLFPEQFNMPKDKNSTWYYNELMKKTQKQPKGGLGKNGQGEQDKDGTGNDGGTIDDHSQWAKMSESDKEVVRQTIESTIKDQGTVPSKIEEQIKKLLKRPTIPWHMVLRHYLRSSVRAFTKASWKRPNRKMGEAAKGKIPDRIAKIIVAIDTSGSVSQDEFTKFMSELYGIQKNYPSDITIIQCDADVQVVDKLKKGQTYKTNMKGRGGTSFVPVFEYIQEKRLNPDVLVYLTDGYGDFPKQPRYSTIWCITPEGVDKSTIPFGRYVQIQKTITEQSED